MVASLRRIQVHLERSLPVDWLASSELVKFALTTLVAIVSGAGGAALLEVWWKPRRDRTAVARILLAEIQNNTHLLQAQVARRATEPKNVPPDLLMELAGWDAAASLVAELPADELKSVLLLYSRYRHLNMVTAYHNVIMQQRPESSDKVLTFARRMEQGQALNAARAIYNTSVDVTIATRDESRDSPPVTDGRQGRPDPNTATSRRCRPQEVQCRARREHQ